MEQDVHGNDYHVFLSFRGPDTRQGFTDVLYQYMVSAGIRVFRDDDELVIGQKIETILLAINGSQICVPIFSENFASSAWCLREVERMVHLKKEMVPIFYKVSPNDVKLKTDRYSKFMAEHEIKYGKERVEKWEDALKATAQLKGRELSSNSYTEFCKEFVSEILMKLRPRREFDLDELIGLENQIKSMMKLMDMESLDVRYIGIHGMGGIGKTTLAKVIFDNCSSSFDSSCFIEDVRESCERNGLRYLEKEMQIRVRKKMAGGSNFSAEEIFRKEKVLLVLDDIDKWEQIEKLAGKSCWFGPGSMPFSGMPLHLISPGFQKKLFPGGLPLALISMGSLLRNEEKEVWQDVIARSKQIATTEVKERLKISFEKLDSDHKQIFLDIACFPFCIDISKAFYMWESCRFFPTYGLEVLKSMSFIKITHNNWIWMHDQFRDLGRDIVRGESFHSRKRSRLWDYDEALKALTSKHKKENVQAFYMDKPCKVKLSEKELETFDNLRLLHMEEAKFEGDLTHLLPELRWLSWISRSKFEASNFTVAKLVILDLSYSSITDTWRGWSLFQSAKCLKVLDLKGCSQLTRTPTFPKKMVLERLILQECDSLAILDSSIGNLNFLRFLNLQDCERLCWSLAESGESCKLPGSISSLVKLENLSLQGCSHVKKLPGSSLGHLKLLVELNLSYTGIVKLPKSIGELGQLKHLDLRYSQLRKVSKCIGQLRSLVSLDLNGTKITGLPSSIGGLSSLETLTLWTCSGLMTLPDSIGELDSLVKLDLDGTKIAELPDSIGNLRKLEQLTLSGCSRLKALPHSIGNLKSLNKLYVSRTAITELPESIGDLEKLQEIRAEGCKLRKISNCFSALMKLEEFHAGSNEFLVELPEGVSSLYCLKNLDLNRSRISDLPSSISQLSLLEVLNLENCDQLRHLPEKTNLPCLSKLTNLLELQFEECSKNKGFEILGIEDLHSLCEFRVVNCNSNHMDGLRLPENLNFMMIKDSQSLRRSPDLSRLRKLEQLVLSGCKRLAEAPGLGNLKGLKLLEISDCSSLERIENLSRLKHLVELDITCCQALTNIEGINRLNLEFFKWDKSENQEVSSGSDADHASSNESPD
ncbi:hypothetical protein SAY87_025797 [Trapa incisa]|uniref:TIR domain-containing protein n=1 Tax=Trapa incisa TaxID=236973 RepID=A0AAN7GS09_9MYRT|nr:hypothetical protein SAY87_025797 [Trapa incisa]